MIGGVSGRNLRGAQRRPPELGLASSVSIRNNGGGPASGLRQKGGRAAVWAAQRNSMPARQGGSQFNNCSICRYRCRPVREPAPVGPMGAVGKKVWGKGGQTGIGEGRCTYVRGTAGMGQTPSTRVANTVKWGRMWVRGPPVMAVGEFRGKLQSPEG